MKLLKCYKEESQPFFFWGFHIFDKWMQIKNNGKSLIIYFEDNLIHSIAIYGLGAIGKRLVEELSQEKIEILYGIDRNAADLHIEGLTVKTLEDDLPKVDAIVVTPISFYEIEKDIYKKMGKDIYIIFIEDVVEYCLNQI